MIAALIARVRAALRFAPEDYTRRQPYKPTHTDICCTMCGRCVVCGECHGDHGVQA